MMNMHTFECGTEVDLDDEANLAWLLLAVYNLRVAAGEIEEIEDEG